MKVCSYPCKIQSPTAVALGRFDGVHPAHQAVINAAATHRPNLTPVVFTFCDNPGKSEHLLLSTEEEKQALIEECGIEILVNATFDSVRNMSAEDFFHTVLLESLNAKALFCGYNYRFGKGASADVATLKALCDAHGITLVCTEEVTSNNTPVSSTAIRNLLISGETERANLLLGRNYSLTGKVVHGNALGRTISTPTLNISIRADKLLPAYGVYATYAHIGGKVMKSVTNIGVKPTVGSDFPTIETYLLDASGDYYNQTCTIELVAFLRKEEKFQSLDTLKAAISNDIEKAKLILK